MTHLWERGHFLICRRLDIIHCHSTIREASDMVLDLRHSDEGPIRVFEVHYGGPVVRFIFFEATRGASGDVGKVERGVHG